MRNTLDNIEKDCAEPGWFGMDGDGRPNEAITHETIMRAKILQPFVPPEMELFPCPDGSVQWEDDAHTVEVYPNKYRYDDEEMRIKDVVAKLRGLEVNEHELTLTITLPKEFRDHFQSDRFKDSFFRILTDLEYSNSNDSLSGLYEKELVEKLQEAFQDAKVVK